jgi:pimeloyl-ACP methyl ester carboxylesterase
MVASMLTPPDRAALADADAGRRFVASMADAYRQGIGAAMHEARLIAKPRPYRLEDIQVPVHVLQGSFDRHVPEAMGHYLARSIPNARWHLFPDEGHLSIVLNRFDDCVAMLARSGNRG